jgi:hypothetical protein
VIINPSLRSLRQLIATRCLYVGGVGFFSSVARVLSGLDACSCGDGVKSVLFLGDPVEQRMLVIIENGGGRGEGVQGYHVANTILITVLCAL